MVKRGFLFLFVILVLMSSANAIFLGTCEGYVSDVFDNKIQGATVNVNVVGCSGLGCSGTYVSDVNGYYVVANLNLNAGGTVTVTAIKTVYDGTETGIANSYQAAFVDVTISRAPTSPTNLVNDTTEYTPSATFSWDSGTDLDGLDTYDEFQLDSESIISPADSPLIETFNFGSHTWKARTCNDYKCSAWTTASFSITQPIPSEPTNLAQIVDSHGLTGTFSWDSGICPAGLPTYDEFQFSSNPIISPADSPVTETFSYGSYTWKARTCNTYGCSGWVSMSFSTSNSAPSIPVLTDVLPTEETSIDFEWVSGTDPDEDIVYDEFQLATDYTFTTLINSSTDATSPRLIHQLPKDTIYYWRVRSCDEFDACSSWAVDNFFIYSCDGATGDCDCSCESGSTGSCSIVKMFSGNCTPKWNCYEWGSCENGFMQRNCYDENGCVNSLPDVFHSCQYQKPDTEDENKTIVVEQPYPVVQKEINWWLSWILFILLMISIFLMLFFYKKESDRNKEIEKRFKERLVIDGFKDDDIKKMLK